ncbi:unnamed protein product [Polarella glacialis]|uniref:Reverse transcriptase Ty1/copia-type domain-containing protein n=1 Tax=Polarella glacialis TaxID=89957 RepID=A0A813E626_POLGL|nr:unnamed protein product [Polarella glacialis]
MIVTHADDFRFAAPPAGIEQLQEEISSLMKIKWTNELGKEWSRYLGSWWRRPSTTIMDVRPDDKHIQAVLQLLQLDGPQVKGSRTPQWSPQAEREVPVPLTVEQTRQYRTAVGCLQWIAIVRPDLQFTAKELARSLSSSTSMDWNRLKKAGRYLVATRHLYLQLECHPDQPLEVEACADASWAVDETRRSTTGVALYLQGVLLYSASKTQATVAKSSAEAELLAANSAASEALCLQSVMNDFWHEVVPVRLHTDSTACEVALEQKGLGKMKHLEVKHLWLQEVLRTRSISIHHVPTADNKADILTSHRHPARTEQVRPWLGLRTDEQEPKGLN